MEVGIEVGGTNPESTPVGAATAEQARTRRRGRFLPALVLFFLAPTVGEVLAGSTPLDLLGSPAIFVVVFLLEALLYGGGALLIREVAHRNGRGWPTILVLGAAYGVLEEGLVTQSFFNPDYLGLHLLGFGSLFGLGWVWITDVLPLHAVWTVGVSIALAELLFRDQAGELWLRRAGSAVALVLLAAGAAGIWFGTYTSQHHFGAPWPWLLGALVVVAALVALALALPPVAAGPGSAAGRRAPHPWLVGAAAFVSTSLFMGVHLLYFPRPDLPGVVPVAATVAIAVVMLAVVLRWSGAEGWGAPHRLALVAGALLTYAWNGFFVISLGDRLDVAGQVAVALLVGALVAYLMVHLRREHGKESTV